MGVNIVMKRRKADSDDEPVEAAIANKRIKQPIAVLGPTFSDEVRISLL